MSEIARLTVSVSVFDAWRGGENPAESKYFNTELKASGRGVVNLFREELLTGVLDELLVNAGGEKLILRFCCCCCCCCCVCVCVCVCVLQISRCLLCCVVLCCSVLC